ncbi:MAG: hopanoid biosynthesis associated radical SAM protein HpnH [bacterium]|nr:MAG: hopanoid biosynthesis associated radical SAM protein HpnH [bacterium]
MRFPISLTWQLSKYLIKKKLAREKHFPLVLMLEPLHACNLSCVGCGRIREYKSTISSKLSLEECIQAVDECEAPVVSLCGGEPLMYPQIDALVQEIINRKRHIYLCSNGVLIPKLIQRFQPNPYLMFNIHLDGTQEYHDKIVNQEGVFEKAIHSIKMLKKAGFQVCTNTTVYRDTNTDDVIRLFSLLTGLNIDGILISPAYGFEECDPSIFLDQNEIKEKFKRIDESSRKFPWYSTPIYRDFLKGDKDLECSFWANVTRNLLGWKAPCYLITDGYFSSYNDFKEEVQWENYGPGKDKRCTNCMSHVGFEATVALGPQNTLLDTIKLISWNLFS